MFKEENQKNLILAIVISIAIVLGWQFLVEAPRLDRERVQRAAQQQQQAAAPAAQSSPSIVATPGAPVAVPDRAAAVSQSPRVKIDTPEVRGSIRLVGAQIDDLQLVRYRETVSPSSPLITLLSPQGSPSPYFAEFGWVANGTPGAMPDGQTAWVADRETLTPTTPVTLSWDNGAGLKFQRRIAIDADFMFEITDRVSNGGTEPVQLQPYGRVQRVGLPKTLGFYILHEGPIGVFNGVLNEPSYDDIKKKRAIKTPSTGGWLGITDKYWLVALVPDQKSEIQTQFLHVDLGGRDAFGDGLVHGGKDSRTRLPTQSLRLNASSTGTP